MSTRVRRTEGKAQSAARLGKTMQDAASGLRGNPLIRSWVNKGKREGRSVQCPGPRRSVDLVLYLLEQVAGKEGIAKVAVGASHYQLAARASYVGGVSVLIAAVSACGDVGLHLAISASEARV